MEQNDILEELQKIGARIKAQYISNKQVLSFQDFLSLFAIYPQRILRDAAVYLRDMFDFYGTTVVHKPWGEELRYRLFDLEFDNGRGRLIGQEPVQREIYRILSNFVREGCTNKLIVLHGPNGSSKSTVISCIMRSLEHYSTLEEGSLYRFSWVFPTETVYRTTLGFREKQDILDPGRSYAYLPDKDIDAKLICELKDNPILLIPVSERQRLIQMVLEKTGIPEYKVPLNIMEGKLCHKCNQIYNALLASYKGDYLKVLQHVQVERFFISRRYCEGAIIIGPQLSIDASERQISVNRSLSALPKSLQNITLFEPYGDLVNAAGGIVEFSDFLKRPYESFKYLLHTIESGEVSLEHSIISLNAVLVATTNEVQLRAFIKHPEFSSFRGRLELVKVPYLLNYQDEEKIYKEQIIPHISLHVAPHTTEITALWAILTRLKRPSSELYSDVLRHTLKAIGPLEKAYLYAGRELPLFLPLEQSKELNTNLSKIKQDSASGSDYEGCSGASPREIRTMLLNIAQSSQHNCLSLFKVIEKIHELTSLSEEYDYLKQPPDSLGYKNFKEFPKILKKRCLDYIEGELQDAAGLIEKVSYKELFERYLVHISAWIKKERILNPVTGEYEEPDKELIAEVERDLDIERDKEKFRKSLISAIAGYIIDHPGTNVDYPSLFPQHFKKLKEKYFLRRKKSIETLLKNILKYLHNENEISDQQTKERIKNSLEILQTQFGYCNECIKEGVGILLKERYLPLVKTKEAP